jgi:hypothetical protein
MRPLLVLLAVLGGLTVVFGSAAAAPRYDFKTPGEAAYCRMEFRANFLDSFRCVTPNDGFWIRFVGLNSSGGYKVHITKGYSPQYRGLRQMTSVLGFGKTFSSSDAQLIVCTSRRSGLTCKYPPSGLSFWLGRYRGYRIYYTKPGYPIHVRPMFRTAYAWCGINLDTLEPANPSLICWHPGTGAEVDISHDDAGLGGGSRRSEQARGFRPRGFRLQQSGTVVWRCQSVNSAFAERCGVHTTGTPVFTCTVSGRIRCTSIRGHGFTLDARAGFTTF